MTRRSLAALSGLVVLGAFACSSGVHEQVEALADRACACTTSACAAQVVDELVALSRQGGRGDQERTNRAAQRLARCAREAGMERQALQDAIGKLGKR